MIWDDEAVSKLCQLNTDGLYASEIATEMKTTRNAIIGKLQRLGVAMAHKPSKERPKKRKPEPRIRTRARFWPRLRYVEPAPLPPDQSFFCELLQLERWSCRYPVEEIGPRKHLFCGRNALDGCSYCSFHALIVYRKDGVDSAA